MAVTRAFLFHSKVNTKVVREIAGTSSFLLNRFSMQPGGKNTALTRKRQDSYDVFNDSRQILQFRGETEQSGVAIRQKAGMVFYKVPRFAEKLPLLVEEIHNQRPLGGTGGQIDEMGEQEVQRQRRILGQRAANTRLALIGGLMRGEVYVHEDSNGDTKYLDYTSASATFTLNFGARSAGNESQLNMTDIDGNSIYSGNIIDNGWENPGADIVKQIMRINAAFKRKTGTRCELVIMNSSLWTYLTTNNNLQVNAGIANSPFVEFRRLDGQASNELPDTEFEARFAALPFVRFVITDEVLRLGTPESPTDVNLVPDNYIWAGPDPMKNRGFFEMLEYAQPTRDRAGAPTVPRRGMYAWVNDDEYDPPVTRLHVQDNCLPVMYIPEATVWAKVANF